MQVPEEVKEASKEEGQGKLEEDREDRDDLRDTPLVEMIQPVLTKTCDLHGGSRGARPVLVQPLLDQDTE